MAYWFDGFELDSDRREVRRNGRPLELQPKVFDLLLYLVRRRDRVVSRDELFQTLWPDTVVSEDALFHALKKARAALGDDGGTQRVIQTVPRVGYRFVAEVEEASFATATEAPAPAREASLVGRESELAKLREVLARVLGGAGQVVLLSGDAGIGKSRVARELARLAEAAGAEVHEAATWQGRGAPAFWLWVQILRSIAQAWSPEPLRRVAGPASGELVRVAPELQEALGPGPSAPAAMHESEAARFRLMDAVAGFLLRAAREKPQVLVLEDLQWAQPGTLQLLALFAGYIADAPLLVVATARSAAVAVGGAASAALASCRQRDVLLELPLPNLGVGEVSSLVAALTGVAPSVELAAALRGATGGNPFFVKQLVRLATEDDDGDEDFITRLALHVAETPAGVPPVLDRRLAALSEPCREFLLAASVVGVEFALAVLGRVCPLSREKLLLVLEEARTARLVEPVAGRRATWRFVHALVRDAAYAALPEPTRVHLHRRVATALEDLHAGALEQVVPELAHHYAEAALLLEGAEAVRYAKWAGDLAVRALSYEEAAVHYERALEAQALLPRPADQRQRAEILIAAGYANHNAGALERAREQLHQAAALAEALPEPRFLALAAVGYAELGVGNVDPESVRLLEAALQALGEGADFLRVWLRSVLVSYLVNQPGRRGDATRLVGAAESGARSLGDVHALSYALCARADLLRSHPEERLRERIGIIDETDALVSGSGDRGLEIMVVLQRRGVLIEQGDRAGVDALEERCKNAVERLGSGFWRFAPLSFDLLRLTLEGRFREAEEVATAGLTSPDLPRILVLGGMLGALMGAIRYHQGRLAETLPMLERLGEQIPHVGALRAGHVLALLAAGAADRARRELEILGRNRFADVVGTESWVFAGALLADACVRLDARDHAQVLAELLESRAEHCVSATNGFYCHGPVALHLAKLACLRGEWDVAEQHLSRAVGLVEGLRSPVWRAHVLAVQAGMLRRRGARGDAVRAEQAEAEACRIARRLGMAQLLGELAPAPPRRRRAQSPVRHA